MRYDFDGSKIATIIGLDRLRSLKGVQSTTERGAGSQVSILIKNIQREIPLACPRFHACTSQRVVRTHRHGEL